MPQHITQKEIIQIFKQTNLDKDYLFFHSKRYEFLLNHVFKLVEQGCHSILDIGSSFQTILMKKMLPDIRINSLNIEKSPSLSGSSDFNFILDLNDTLDQKKWPDIPTHDIVILAEVLEHLYTSPKVVLRYLSSLLNPNGYLIIQTPNAVSIHKRILMLLGKNPYEMIREDRINPGHFREYTIKELVNISQETGLTPVKIFAKNYFTSKNKAQKLYDFFGSFLTKNLRLGITIILKKSS